jgi:AraC-like DNA-binding protein
LFFNVTSVPILSIKENELYAFENSWDIFCIEMKSKDNLQYDMLQSILKRIIILCARKLKSEKTITSAKREADILREFRFLVENYFVKHHDVAFYASMLNKSPKTLSNLFSSLSDRTPIDIIHERIMVHARKQIFHTTKSIKEIAYDLGYEDSQTFSRFFKNKEGLSPVQYREKGSYS